LGHLLLGVGIGIGNVTFSL